MNALRRLKKRLFLDPSLKRFIQHNKKKWLWNSPEQKDSVILLDFYDDYANIFCYSYVLNYLAKKTHSRIGCFTFIPNRLGLPQRRLQKLYESFGAKVELELHYGGPYSKEAKAFAENEFRKLKDKNDLIKMSVDDIRIGDLICQTYLRDDRYTIDIKDQKLRDLIERAYIVFKSCESYFKENKVHSVFVSHTIFINYGIITRIALKFDVPVYRILSSGWRKKLPFHLMKVHKEYHFQALPFWDYKKIIAALPKEHQEAKRKIGQDLLLKRFEGMVEVFALKATSAYTQPSETRILQATNKPKFLIMLSCFFDGPHIFRHTLFADFYEWAVFTLKTAYETNFEWYVKPHPTAQPNNKDVIALLKEQFPKVHFLDPKVSNKQLLLEGIQGMFTCHGSAIHEFAYMGLPVVAAGDNMHAAYNFYLQAKTKEEYAHLILNADKLQVQIDKSEVEEFVYMQYFHYWNTEWADARPIDSDFEQFAVTALGHNLFEGALKDTRVFDYFLKHMTPQREQKILEHLDFFFQEAS